ncbi:MAG: hypothetical protein QNJ23_00795 [Woeseiaceae bacterium]|nr:hypothetical protein [Woeseiaceae bacterium]
MYALKRIRFVTLGLLALSCAAAAQQTAPEFARVDHDADQRPRALQMSIASYVPVSGDGLLQVDLVGAIHIGDPAYYAELNERFRDYDVLLYELIAPEGGVSGNQLEKRKGLLSSTQIGMTKMLDLSFQLDEVDYDAANFVHADLTPTELRASMEERGESLYVYFWRIFFATLNEYAKDPLGLRDMQMLSGMLSSGQDDSFKVMIAYEMTNLDSVEEMLGDDSTNAVIGARNQRAVDVLKREIEAGARRIGIFYGVAHMPDIEERLFDQLDLEWESTDWVDAWQLGDGDRGEPRKNLDNL